MFFRRNVQVLFRCAGCKEKIYSIEDQAEAHDIEVRERDRRMINPRRENDMTRHRKKDEVVNE